MTWPKPFLVFFVAILNGMQVSKTVQNHQNLTFLTCLRGVLTQCTQTRPCFERAVYPFSALVLTGYFWVVIKGAALSQNGHLGSSGKVWVQN
jgi:hypothetical protein